MQVHDIRNFKETQQPLLALEGDTPLLEAVREMGIHNYGAAAVLENGKYAGLFTERMLLKNVVGHEKNVRDLRLKDVMDDHAAVHLGDDAQEVLNRLDSLPYRHVPVLDEENHFVGMLSDRDFAVYTWPEAIGQAAETARIGMASAYQPFFIIGALLIYTLFIIYLSATFFQAGSLWF